MFEGSNFRPTGVDIFKKNQFRGYEMNAKIWKEAFVFVAVTVMALIPFSPDMSFAAEGEVRVYGWLRNNLGMFTDQIDFAGSGNDLSTCRTWLRTYVEYEASDQISTWVALQFAHEPTYHMEKGSMSSNVHYAGEPTARSGKEYSEYRDINDVLRECFIRWQPSVNHGFKLGRQIMIWGEAMTQRVGDVIHPDDGRYALGFANLEDSRIPMWMLRGTHYFEGLKGMELDWLVSPNLMRKEFSVGRSGNYATIANIGGNILEINTTQRLGIRPDDRQFGVESKYPTAGNGAYGRPSMVNREYPENSLDDLRYGFRIGTSLFKSMIYFSYFHTQNYTPSAKLTSFVFGPIPGASFDDSYNINLVYPDEDIFGFSMNSEMPKGLLRAEAIWVPNRTFAVWDPDDADKIDKRNYIKYMAAYDITLFFQWNKSSPLNLTFEHVGDYYPDNDHILYFGGIVSERQYSYTPTISMSARMSFINRWDLMQVVSYLPKDKSGLTISSVTYKPIWMNNAWQLKLQYIRVFSDEYYKGLGPLEQKDQVVFTTQYNFFL